MHSRGITAFVPEPGFNFFNEILEHGLWSIRNRGRRMRWLVIIAMLETFDHGSFQVVNMLVKL